MRSDHLPCHAPVNGMDRFFRRGSALASSEHPVTERYKVCYCTIFSTYLLYQAANAMASLNFKFALYDSPAVFLYLNLLFYNSSIMASNSFIYSGIGKLCGQCLAQEPQPTQADGCFSSGRLFRLFSLQPPSIFAAL